MVAWPLEVGLGTRNPCFVMLRFESFVVWPLDLVLGTRNPRLLCGPLSCSSGLTIHALFAIHALLRGPLS